MQRSLHFILPTFFLVFLSSPQLFGQNNLEIRGGLGLGAQAPIGSFISPPQLPNPSTPLAFSPQDIKWLPQVFAGADIQVDSSWRVGAMALFARSSMDFAATEQTVIATPTGGLRRATLGHTLHASISAFGLRPYGRWRVEDNVALEVGTSFVLPITSSYLQTMRFTDPANVTFVDGSLEQTTGSGTMPGNNAMIVGLDVMAEWMISISDRLWLTPSVSVGTNLTSWNKHVPLRTVNITPAVGVRFKPWPSSLLPVQDTTYIRDTVVILSSRVKDDSTERIQQLVEQFPTADTVRVVVTEHYRTYMPKPPAVLRASLRLLFETEDGGLSTDARLRVSTVKRTRIVPVLPLVVFDDSSSSLPTRYVSLNQEQAKAWTVDRALTGGTHWQYHVLNIAGARLRAIGNATVQIITYDDGTQQGKLLAQERVTNVKAYLTTTFGVASSRLTVEVKNGQRSQQPWVFVVDTLRRILAPIQVTDTITESLLPRVRIQPDVVSEAGVKSWIVSMSQSGNYVHSIDGNGTVPATLIWDMNESLQPEQAFLSPISVQISITDNEGTKAHSDPGLVTIAEVSTTDKASRQRTRTEVLRWIGADFLHTPDVDMFGLTPTFDRIEVYPSNSRRAEFFVVNAPATLHPVGAKAWFRDGLESPERALFDHVELYIKESR